MPNQLEITRFGVVAGRTIGKAVQRNRAKRLLREAVRSYLRDILPGLDVLLIARQSMVGATFQQTRQVLHSLMNRARLLKEHHDF